MKNSIGGCEPHKGHEGMPLATQNLTQKASKGSARANMAIMAGDVKARRRFAVIDGIFPVSWR